MKKGLDNSASIINGKPKSESLEMMPLIKIPDAPSSIKKGFPLKFILDQEAIHQLAENLKIAHGSFDKNAFIKDGMQGIEPLSLTERSNKIADVLKKHLPENYEDALKIILKSLSPPLERTVDNGLSPLFYLPHSSFIAKFGLSPEFNNDKDPFKISMQAQYEITKRFTCEYSIRHFIIKDEERTLKVLYKWMKDDDPHVRRLCSEGTRPRLPWSMKIDSFVKNPAPSLPILEQLKNDPDLYVRRSVANHVGDIAKDNLDLALNLCENWLKDASSELKWVIRHAVRNPIKKGNTRATAIRKAAK